MSVFLQRLRWMTASFNKKSSSAVSPRQGLEISDVEDSDLKSNVNHTVKDINKVETKRPMLEAVYDIAIYIHRFHNLDLFQQGWCQLKITMRWEDDEAGPLATPARVVQYEAPDLGCDDMYGVWRIDDTDHSFLTQPFRTRYARQDILLSMMVSFNLPLGNSEDPVTSSVILKFELLYSPVLEKRYDLQACLNSSPAAVHEFQIPPIALLGMHAYCPVHFDAFHAVLVDTTVHATILKSGVFSSSLQCPPTDNGADIVGGNENENQVLLFKALLSARNFLVETLQKLGKAINGSVDMKDLNSKELFGFTLRTDNETDDAEVSKQASSKSYDMFEVL